VGNYIHPSLGKS